MIDRIEELLGPLAAEDEEEREDVLALTVPEEAVPASPRGDEGEAGDGEADDRSGGRTAGETKDGGTGDRSGGRTAGEIALERPGLVAGETETAVERVEANRELWKDGPVWMVRSGSPEMDEAQKAALTGRTAQAGETPQPAQGGGLSWAGLERVARGSTAGLTLEGAERSRLGQAGLEGLYRQTVRGLRPAAPALPPEQAGRTTRAQEPGSAASLAVDELDRAVRRDSRRYDGGMSIY